MRRMAVAPLAGGHIHLWWPPCDGLRLAPLRCVCSASDAVVMVCGWRWAVGVHALYALLPEGRGGRADGYGSMRCG